MAKAAGVSFFGLVHEKEFDMRSKFVIVGLLMASVFALSVDSDAAKPKKKVPAPARWMKTDLGPVFSSSFRGAAGANIPKGIAVRVGGEGQAAVLYDEDLVRMHAAWTGGFVNIDPGRDALLGNDSLGGSVVYSTPVKPGWSGATGFE